MKQFAPVIMDCTHSVQRPGGKGSQSDGDGHLAVKMAQAGKLFGAQGFFMETHPNPTKALSDGANMIQLIHLKNAIKSLLQ